MSKLQLDNRQGQPLTRWLMAAGWVLLTIAVLAVLVYALYAVPLRYVRGAADPITAANSARGPLATLFIGIGALVTAVFTARNYHLARRAQGEQRQLALDAQVGDQFAKFVDQLGNRESMHVRLGAIYALERFAANFPKEVKAVTLLLGAFVRFPVTPPEPEKRLAPDVQAALGTLVRSIPSGYPVNLTKANLREAGLWDARMRSAYLVGTDFTNAEMVRSDLAQANMEGAILTGAILCGADLSRASLINADLRNAVLSGCVFKGADLRGANLQGAVFTAQVRNGLEYPDSDPSPALGLTKSQVREAIIRQEVINQIVDI